MLRRLFRLLPQKLRSGALGLSHVQTNEPLETAIHSGESEPGKNHLQTWVPLFQKSGVAFCIITRTAALFTYSKKAFPGVPVIFANKDVDLENAYQYLGSLKTIFYPSNPGNNIHSIRFNRFKHVFLGHGDSEKTASAHKLFRMYDEVWVSGQAHIDRFHNADFDTAHIKFMKIGRPMLQESQKMLDTRNWRERFSQPQFCYLPTWEGIIAEQSYSSLPLAGELLTNIVKARPEAAIVIKLHPLSGTRNDDFKKLEKDLAKLQKSLKKNITILPRASPLPPLLPRANIFICDVSAAVTDCLLPDVPVFVFMNPQAPRASSNMPLESFTYTFEGVEEFLFKVQAVLQGNDFLAHARKEAREYFLGLQEMEEDSFNKLLRRV